MSGPVLAWLLVSGLVPIGGGVREIHEVTVTIGDATVRALCTDGPRDVLLLHDAGASAEAWRPVLERLDEQVGACAYDRRGSGRSVPVPAERVLIWRDTKPDNQNEASRARESSRMLTLNNIEVIYDNIILVLKGVYLHVPDGKIVTLLGSNGAGNWWPLSSVTMVPGYRVSRCKR